MRNKKFSEVVTKIQAADVQSGSSLLPMLISGLVLIVLGMIGVLLFV